MFLFILTAYHCFKSYYFPENRNDRVKNRRKVNPEIQDIFESCALEEDNKVRSSVVIEAVTLKYCLNEKVKCDLINRLDPNSMDITYSKEDLFTVFKDWISGNRSPNYLSPLLLPCSSRFRPSSSSVTSTPICITTRTKQCFIPFSDPQSQEEYSYEVEDAFDLGDTHSSHSSTKKKLTFHKSILESRLNHSEDHANSIEKKYETLNVLFEKQKQELERLKQELKTHREMEQSMEEINEQTRKTEKEAEARYSKIQLDLHSANSKIELLESMVNNLNENLLEAQKNLEKKESEILTVRHRMEFLEVEASRKDSKIQDLIKQINDLERTTADKDFCVSVMLEEKLALSNELNDLRERLLILSEPQDIGVPLCDELPSAMIYFPENSICSSSLTRDTSINSNRIVSSQETQTDLSKVEDKIFTSQKTQTDFPSIQHKVEDKVSSIITSSSCSQTELRTVTSSETQTDLPTIEVKFVSSQETQTDLSKVNDKTVTSSEDQTDSPKTELKTFKSIETQTDLPKIEVKSWVCRELQTETNSPDVHLPQRVKHFLMILLRFAISTMTTSLSILVALFAILIMYLYICQNNRCVPSLRFTRGAPPV